MNATVPTPSGPAATAATSANMHERPGVGFRIGLIVGSGVLAFGVRGLVTEVDGDRVRSIVTWIVGAGLAHDLVLAPIAIGIGWLTGRRLAPWVRVPVTGGLFATGVVALVGWAPWRGYGRSTAPGNSSVLPLDYATAILTVLAVIWLAASCWAVLRFRRRHPHRIPDGRDPITP